MQLPSEYIKIAQQITKSSDKKIEQDIYSQYLQNIKRILEDRYYQIYQDNIALKNQVEKFHITTKAANQVSNDENKSDPSGLKSRLKNISKDSYNMPATINPATGIIGQLQEVSNTVQLLPRRGSSAVIRDESSLGMNKDNSANQLPQGSLESES